MRFGVLPGTARLYVTSICVLAAVLAGLSPFLPAGQAPIELFVLLTLTAAVTHSFPISTPGKHAYHLSLPFLVAAIILLSPVQLVALVSVAHLADWLRRRRSATAQLFNAAVFTVTSLLAQAAYRGLAPAQTSPGLDLGQPAWLAAALVAVVMAGLLNRCLVSLGIWLGNRIAPSQQHLFGAESLLTDCIVLLLGVPLAHLAVVAPWSAALAAAPVWFVHRLLAQPNARAQRQQDGLTELVTAAYLTETCTHELNRARRFGRPMSLLVLELDGLGELNAAHGSGAGDAALRSVAHTLGRTVREYDIPACLDSRLFAVLLPETDLAQARDVAERVGRELAKRPQELPNSVEQVRLTLSIGAAVLHGGNASADQVFEAARGALASARDDGGNQVAFVVLPKSTAQRGGRVREFEGHRPVYEASGRPARTGSVTPSARAPSSGPGQSGRSAGRRWPGERSWRGARIVLACLLALGLAGLLVLSTPPGEWRLLAALASVAMLAGLAFYFKSLSVAVALAIELHRSSARLGLVRYWRLWPLYVAVGATGLLVAYAYYRVGVVGAVGLGAAALVFRQLAGQYADRTLESVRTLRTANQELETLAFHDPLTRLANRTLFAERLERAMVRSGDGSVAVLFLDLDDFKTVNDTLGHGVGDALLLAATGRLSDCVRREDTLARLGGDEFTILLENMHDPSDAVRLAERIGDALRAPFDLAGQQVVISASIGIALDTDRSHTPDDLLREADMAMYRAKSGGKARYEILDTGLGTRAMERLELETELRQAVQRGQLVLHYQPIVDLGTGRLEGVEALLRWQHPLRGLLEPPEFMPVAEQTGTVLDIGQSALQQACTQAAAWQVIRPGLVVHVNLSQLELQQSSLVALVAQALASSGLPPRCLNLEVPESAAARNGEAIRVILEAMQGLGVRTTLDDVGNGVSSLAWLSRSPVDTLKIGAPSVDATALVRASVALAAALGMTVTAQGVDDAERAQRLAALGCRHGQGRLYGGPQSAAAIAALASGGRVIARAA